jgi:hypothetical protein
VAGVISNYDVNDFQSLPHGEEVEAATGEGAAERPRELPALLSHDLHQLRVDQQARREHADHRAEAGNDERGQEGAPRTFQIGEE